MGEPRFKHLAKPPYVNLSQKWPKLFSPPAVLLEYTSGIFHSIKPYPGLLRHTGRKIATSHLHRIVTAPTAS